CTDITGPITITPAVPPAITNISTTDVLCNGHTTGVIDVTIDTSVGVAPYTIEVFADDGFGNPTGSDLGTTGLAGGNYIVVVTDDKSCSVSQPATIGEPDPITYDVTKVDITCSNPGGSSLGEITVSNVLGGTAEYTYH